MPGTAGLAGSDGLFRPLGRAWSDGHERRARARARRADPTRLPGHWTEGTVAVDGVDLHYTRTGGEGPPLVIAHGVFDDGPCRSPLARDPEGDYDVVMIEALGLEHPILFGHSMGGDTVAATAARHHDLPRAVVMEDPGAMLRGPPDEDEEELASVLADADERGRARDRELAAHLPNGRIVRDGRVTPRREPGAPRRRPPPVHS